MLKAIDIGERILLLLICAPFLIRFSTALPENPWLLALLLSELFTVILILIRRPGAIAAEPYAIVIAFIGTAMPLLVAAPLAGGNFWLADVLMLCGFLLSLSAKVSLNRRFGVIAANRGVQAKGAYRLVRHPMYLGYIITQIGYLMVLPILGNLLIYLCTWSFQVLRIREEEKFLMQDEAYREFAARTRYRLIPGVF